MRTYIFGPVPSRRLGISLGVDLTPTKTCSFDCVYCQLSKTRFHQLERKRFCPPKDVIKELREVLEEIAAPDWITFSGTGEPTLNRDLGFIISESKKFCPAPICVITNSSLLHLAEVRKDLILADRILPTLTTINSKTFKKIHRPVAGIEIDMILTGLKEFSAVYPGFIELEIFVIPGINDSDEEVAGLRSFILEMPKVDSIYLNTAVRMPLENEVQIASQQELESFRKRLNLKIPIIIAFERNMACRYSARWKKTNAENEILKLLLRHPCNTEQLKQMLNIEPMALHKLLEQLKHQNKIKLQKNGDWKLVED